MSLSPFLPPTRQYSGLRNCSVTIETKVMVMLTCLCNIQILFSCKNDNFQMKNCDDFVLFLLKT